VQNWAHVTIIGKERLYSVKNQNKVLPRISRFAKSRRGELAKRIHVSRLFFENGTCGLIFGVYSVVRI